MDNRVDLPGYKHYTLDGRRPACHVVFLDVVASAGSFMDAVAFPVAAAELVELDARERNYERVEVTARLAPALPGRAWLYRGRAEARKRCQSAGERGEAVVDAGYLAAVTGGFTGLLGRDVAIPTPPFPTLALRRHDRA